MSAQVQESCPECDGRVTTMDSETVCRDCGIVLADQEIDHGPEWRVFPEDESSPSRVGPARTERRHDHGLGSEIGHDDTGNTKQLYRMRRENSRAAMEGKKGRNKAQLLTEVRRICGQLDVTGDAVDRACRVAQVGHDNDITVGESIDTFAAAAVLAGLRDHGLPLSIAQLLEYTDASRRDVYRMLQKTYDETNASAKPVEPVEYLPRIASDADASNETEGIARRILLRAQEKELHVGQHPSALAAAALYIAGQITHQWITQSEAAEAADTTKHTLRRHRERLVDEAVIEEVKDGE